MTSLSSSSTIDHLLAHLLQDSAYAVSDNSYPPIAKTGFCTWILSTLDGAYWTQGGGLIPGCAKDQDLYRSELDR